MITITWQILWMPPPAETHGVRDAEEPQPTAAPRASRSGATRVRVLS
jgi:hypothetical protein